ncbi:MAG: AAA family ATPase [Firmicutes bacterium]|nr:AAA family ATPase [Bacillota bacterium]
MIKIAIYGKGGIGKSTLCSNISAALAKKGVKVMQIGCDPKSDSTVLLNAGEKLPSIMKKYTEKGSALELKDIVFQGENGVLCCETGGPPPGTGCAGRGIINSLERLEKLNAYGIYKPDIVIFDVLGDVVCGGFSMPMRKGYAQKVYVVTSSEKMSRYACGNISMAVENFKGRDYAELGGYILNKKTSPEDNKALEGLCKDFNTQIIGEVEYDPLIKEAEEKDTTVIKTFPESKVALSFMNIAEKIYV